MDTIEPKQAAGSTNPEISDIILKECSYGISAKVGFAIPDIHVVINSFIWNFISGGRENQCKAKYANIENISQSADTLDFGYLYVTRSWIVSHFETVYFYIT